MKVMIMNDVEKLVYQNLRKNFDTMICALFGDGYYNESCDVYSCDDIACRDIMYKCGKKYGKKFDELTNYRRRLELISTHNTEVEESERGNNNENRNNYENRW